MATTKIFPITATEAKALAYIANPDKTNNGRLILTSGCSEDPYQASRDFDEIRKLGTGLSTVLSQHFIQSFAPGEITPEQALQVGEEMCERFLKGEYQYFLAVHNDRDQLIKNDGSLTEIPPDFLKRATELCSQLRCSSISYDIADPQDGEHTKLRVLECGYAE